MTLPSLLHRLLPRATARLRLTLTFGLVVCAVGGSIVTSIYLVMSYVPAYDITSNSSVDSSGDDTPPLPSAGSPASTVDGVTITSVESGFIKVTGPREILNLLLTTSLIVFAVVLVLGVLICWFVAGRVLRPLERISAAATTAAAGNLDHRIALDGPDDEFRRLADAFDDMLARLERSFKAQRRFAANASHELRTPLATTQAILDVALLEPEAVDPEALTRKLRETNTRNIETVESLLALSDAQAGTMSRERVELDDTAREVLASHQEAAAERNVVVHAAILAGSATGDPTLIRLLMSNLVGNAIRYNVAGGDVWLTVANGRVRVENTGVDIDDDDLPRLTEPFFRAAGRVAGSHGLGLALVEAIVSGHGTGLEIDRREGGGLIVEVTFPR